MDTPEQKNIRAAVGRVIMAIGKVRKDGVNENNRYTSTFATLENVLDTVCPLLFSEGIVMSQKPDVGADGRAAMVLSFIDTAGNELEYCRSHISMGRHYDKNGQEIGASPQVGIGAQTYLARTQISHVFRLNMFDDDGCNASGIDTRISYTKPTSPTPKPPFQSTMAPKAEGQGWDADEGDEGFTFKGRQWVLKEMTVKQLAWVCYTGQGYPDPIIGQCNKELLKRVAAGNAEAIKAVEDNSQP